MLETKRSRIGLVLSLALVILLLGSGAWLFFNRQYVIDQVSVWNYKPAAAMTEIVDDISLSDAGQFYLYTTHPSIASAEEFNTSCPQREVNNPILGCYNGDRIFIYDIKEASLEGIKQVTAAHEMLHAAWDRLNDQEKDRISELLKKEYDTITDPRFHERMDYYERTEPGQFYNELHSIIPTERKTIGNELEDYYKRYFNDRQAIVEFHDSYSEVFQELEMESDRLYDALMLLDKQIDSKQSTYLQDLSSLSADIEDFNRRADSGDFNSTSEFNSERAALMTRTDQLEADRLALNDLIERYNDQYYRYQAVASQIQRLNNSIDSMSTVPSSPSLDG